MRTGSSRISSRPFSFSSSSSVARSEEHTSELQSLAYLVCRLLLEKKKKNKLLSGFADPCVRFYVPARQEPKINPHTHTTARELVATNERNCDAVLSVLTTDLLTRRCYCSEFVCALPRVRALCVW